MARSEYILSQTDLAKRSPYSHQPRNYPAGKDINEFIISTLDPNTGSVKETLSLSGTHLPFQPFTAPVSQDVEKFYYPGGQLNRTPTFHVKGSMDEDIIVRGRFKATKIYDVNRRNEPLTISRILERFVREGNVCLFQLGEWIKYGMLVQTTPKYKTDADIDWEIRIMVIGDKNPINGESLEQENNEIARVFSSDEVEDPTALAQEIARQIDESRKELEESGDLPKCNLTAFTVKAYLNCLRGESPVGRVISVASDIYDGYLEMMEAVDSVLDEVENFSSIVEKTSFEINKAILNVTSQVSRLYKVQQDLFVSYASISSSLDTFSRLGSFNTLGNLINFNNNLLLDFKKIEESLRDEQFNFIQKTYVTKETDTYQSISTRFYGTWERWEEIKDFNGQGEIQGGELLLIPR